MTFRFSTEDIGVGSYNVIQLDGSSKLPAVDGSLLTGVSGTAANGAAFTYVAPNSETFTAKINHFYWLWRADLDPAISTSQETSAAYFITLPTTDISLGTKVAFEIYPRAKRPLLVNPGTHSQSNLSQNITSNSYSITVPSSVGTAYTSFKLLIKGELFTEGQTWTSGGKGRNKSLHLYAFVDGTDVTWVDVKGGPMYLGDLWGMDVPEPSQLTSGRSYQLIGSTTTAVLSAVPLWQHIRVTGNTTLAFGTSAGQIDPRIRRCLITVVAGTSPTITLPLGNTSLGFLLIFKVLPNFKNTILSSTVGRTQTSAFTLQRQGSDTFQWSAGVANQTTFTTFTAPLSTFTDATGVYSPSIYYVYSAAGTTTWVVMRAQTGNSY